jgi:hypothetical protein
MNAVFTGRRRSGKTTLAFRKALDGGGGIIVFDPKREFRGWPCSVSSIAEINDAMRKKEPPRVIIFHPEGDANEEFTLLGDWIMAQHALAMDRQWDKKGFHFTLLVDEAHNIQGSNWSNKKLLEIVSQNRPEILNVFQTFQSPKDAWNRIKSRISDWYIFSTNLPSDLEYLQKEIGVSEQDVARIQTLGDHEYAHFYFDGGRPVAQFNTEPKSWYISLEFNEQEKKQMARDDERDDREHRPKYPLQVESDKDIFAAYDKINKRKKNDPESKYRGRASDREEQSSERGKDGKKVFTMGDWHKDKKSA